jgi:hypothetical protein
MGKHGRGLEAQNLRLMKNKEDKFYLLDIFLAVAYDTSIDRQRRVSVKAMKHNSVPASLVMLSLQ